VHPASFKRAMPLLFPHIILKNDNLVVKTILRWHLQLATPFVPIRLCSILNKKIVQQQEIPENPQKSKAGLPKTD
jgi:hypothetical protein